MLTVVLCVAVLFKVFHVENVYFCTYFAFALGSRLTIAIRIDVQKDRAAAAFSGDIARLSRRATVSIKSCRFGTGKRYHSWRLSRPISTENNWRERAGMKDRLCHLTNDPSLPFICTLRYLISLYVSHASGTNKWRVFRLDSLRLQRRLAQSIHCDLSQILGLFIPGHLRQ
jgi:hypothetical protein